MRGMPLCIGSEVYMPHSFLPSTTSIGSVHSPPLIDAAVASVLWAGSADIWFR